MSPTGVVDQVCDDMSDNKTSGPGGAGNTVTPALTPTQEGLMSDTMPPAYDSGKQARG